MIKKKIIKYIIMKPLMENAPEIFMNFVKYQGVSQIKLQ